MVEDYSQHFEIEREIGRGTFGTVQTGKMKGSEVQCAVKFISKSSLKNQDYFQLNKNALEIVEEISHPHIVRVYELLEDRANFHIVMELMQGGSLQDQITNSPSGHLSELQSVSVIHQILLGLHFMHGMGIMHCDINAENVLCEELSDQPLDEIHVKLSDFGFAIKTEPGEKIEHFPGIPQYLAPEIIENLPYDSKVDVWALGVLVFKMLSGHCPFEVATRVRS